MYVSIYGYSKEGTTREHLGNITNVKVESTEKVYDLSTASIEGYCNFNMEEALIYVINTEEGRQISAGFVRNAKVIEGNLVSFRGEDFKKILDTDIMVDFTGPQTEAPTLQVLLNKVTAQVQSSNSDDYMSHVLTQFIVPTSTIDIREVADYSGQYLIVNALKFLKVYLAYYGYYIKPRYSITEDIIQFTFIEVKESEVIEIKLKDFKHERVLNDIKLNKAVATIKYTLEEMPPEWVESTSDYYLSQPASNRALVGGSESMPSAAGYPPGFALSIETIIAGNDWEETIAAEYHASNNKVIKTVNIEGTACRGATLGEAKGAAGLPSRYPTGTVVRVVTALTTPDGMVTLCGQSNKYLAKATTSYRYSYYRVGDIQFKARPNMPERIYLLGKDNQIYEGYDSIENENRIYPVITKIFESTYLAEAQVNAVYELVNNRYVENIIINNESTQAPIDLSNYELYQMFRVYDDEGSFKDLPISEKSTRHEKGKTSTTVKLGFKKTLLTDVIKNDIGEGSLIRQGSGGGGGGSTQVIEEKYEIWDKPTAPPANIDTWFKPIGESPTGSPTMMRVSNEAEESQTGISYDDSEQVEVENEFGADGISQDTTPQLPREEDDR